MAYSDFSLTDMDMNVCMLDRGRVTLGHYYVKQEIFPPFPHAGVSFSSANLLFIGPALSLSQLHYYCHYYRDGARQMA